MATSVGCAVRGSVGFVGFGSVWFGLVWFGSVRFGSVWFGLVWFGGLVVCFDSLVGGLIGW